MPNRKLFRKTFAILPKADVTVDSYGLLRDLAVALGPFHGEISRSGSLRQENFYECRNGRYTVVCTNENTVWQVRAAIELFGFTIDPDPTLSMSASEPSRYQLMPAV